MTTTTGAAPQTLIINPLKGSKSQAIEIPTNLTVLEHEQLNSGSNNGMFRIINQTDGDKRVVWDKFNITELNEAKKLFDKLVEQGMTPYVVDDKGKITATVMSEFDPHAEEVIFAPMQALVGG